MTLKQFNEVLNNLTEGTFFIVENSKEELKNKNVKEVQLKIEEFEIFEEKKSNLEIIETLENEANEIDDVVLKIQSLFIIKNIKKCAIKNLEELKRSFVRLHNFYYNITSYKDANKMLEYLGNFEKKIIKLNLF